MGLGQILCVLCLTLCLAAIATSAAENIPPRQPVLPISRQNPYPNMTTSNSGEISSTAYTLSSTSNTFDLLPQPKPPPGSGNLLLERPQLLQTPPSNTDYGYSAGISTSSSSAQISSGIVSSSINPLNGGLGLNGWLVGDVANAHAGLMSQRSGMRKSSESRQGETESDKRLLPTRPVPSRWGLRPSDRQPHPTSIGQNFLQYTPPHTPGQSPAHKWLGSQPSKAKPIANAGSTVQASAGFAPLENKGTLDVASGRYRLPSDRLENSTSVVTFHKSSSSSLSTIASGGRYSVNGNGSALENLHPATNKSTVNGTTFGGTFSNVLLNPSGSSVLKPHSKSNLSQIFMNSTGGHDALFGIRQSYDDVMPDRSLLTGNTTTNCSGTLTVAPQPTIEVTSTILVNETITLAADVPTPSPILILPLPACVTIAQPCSVCVVYNWAITTTLLVTKKSPAVVRQGQQVGRLFGAATSSPYITTATGNTESSSTAAQTTWTRGVYSGSSSGTRYTAMTAPSVPQPTIGNGLPSESKSQQRLENWNAPPVLPDKKPQNVQQSPADVSEGGDSGIGDGSAYSSGRPGPTLNQQDGGGIAMNGDRTSPSLDGSQAPSISEASSPGQDQNGKGQSSNNGGLWGASEGNGSPSSGSKNGPNEYGYGPTAATTGKFPLSIGGSAIIVDSHTVSAGSPPTTIIADGQIIAVDSSQIVASGTRIPIAADASPAPARSVQVSNVAVVLRPSHVIIGSETFSHGTKPSAAIYDGRTYSWDSTRLMAPGTTLPFPSADAEPPTVSAGGQVFSVLSSYLKASGMEIAIPSETKPSPFVLNGQTFSINPSQLIAPDHTIALSPATKPIPFVYNDHTLSVDISHLIAGSATFTLTSSSGTVTYMGQQLIVRPTEVIAPSTTITLPPTLEPGMTDSPTTITTRGHKLTVGPAAAIVGSNIYSFLPGKASEIFLDHGQNITVGPQGVKFESVDIPVPTHHSTYSVVTQDELIFSIASSEVVLNGHSYKVQSKMSPITTTIGGQTIKVGHEGVVLASTTVPLPQLKPSFSVFVEGGLTLSIAPSKIVFQKSTYSVGPNFKAVTTIFNDQSIEIGPSDIRVKGLTVDLPTPTMQVAPATTTFDGLSFHVGATDAIVDGATYAIGSGAAATTIVVGSETVGFGLGGVMLPSTTIHPEETRTIVTAGGITFSADASEAVINGSTFAIGNGASARTVVEGSETIRLGTGGIILPSTTIRPWTFRASTNHSSVSGTSAASKESFTPAMTLTAPMPTGTNHRSNDAGGHSNPSDCKLMAMLLGGSVLGLVML